MNYYSIIILIIGQLYLHVVCLLTFMSQSSRACTFETANFEIRMCNKIKKKQLLIKQKWMRFHKS